ncbi:MAG: hypothetical protein PHX25_02090 [Candidatus Pacebacteria bacterium]|nr:hypothetical protein [Candidatus Paceibacterota bacterium]
MEFKDRIVIVDCCGERFSKIIEEWYGKKEFTINENLVICLFSGQLWDVLLDNIFPAKSEVNPYEFDVLFTTSEDENLFLCLCDSIGKEKGWFEGEGACKKLKTIRG